MAHHTYTTDALVLGYLNRGEGNRSIVLYTREFGRVHAFARSVRETRSKLRFALQPYTHVSVSLVRGKDAWRVVGAVGIEYFSSLLQGRQTELLVVSRLLALAERLVGGEEKHDELFTLLLNGLRFVSHEALEPDHLAMFEYIFAIRALYLLGYVGEITFLGSELESQSFSKTELQNLMPFSMQLVREINESIRASHL